MGDCLMITGSTGIAKPVGVIGGDGHDIINASGVVMAQEDGLQFASGCVEDDAVNGKTVYIEMIRISQANYKTLKANGQLKPGAKYFVYDAQPVAVNASNLPYSSTQSTKQKIDEVDGKLKYKPGDVLSGTIIFNGWVQNPKSLSFILDKEMDSSVTEISIQNTNTGGVFYLRSITGLVSTTPNIAIKNVTSWNGVPNTSFAITFDSNVVNSTLEQTPVVIAFDGSITFS